MRKFHFLLAGVAIVALCSCADTSELYPGDAYIQPVMTENRYNKWDAGIREKDHSTFKTVSHGQDGYFNGSGNYEEPRDCFGLQQAKEWHPEGFKDGEKDLTWTLKGDGTPYGEDIVPGPVGQWADNSSLIGKVYGQTKKLTRYHSAFSKGYLSKLYNGQIKCNAWSSYSLVLLDQSGYGTRFPVTMQGGSYFAFSARGASDTLGEMGGRVVSFDIYVSFYKYMADGKTIESSGFFLPEVKLQANYSSEFTSLVGFYFDDVGYDPRGTIGMSMSYRLHDDPFGASADFDEESTYHIGLALLEVFFPDSSWA